MAFASKITQSNGVQERRRSHVPIGRPRKGTRTERAKLKGELTPYGKKLEESKTKRKTAVKTKKPAGKKATKATVKKIVARKSTKSLKKDPRTLLSRYERAYAYFYSVRNLDESPQFRKAFDNLVSSGRKLLKAYPEDAAALETAWKNPVRSDRELAAYALAWSTVRIPAPRK